MTLLTTASRRAKQAEQSHFFMPTRLSDEESNKATRLIWWGGLPLCLIIGAIANYCWHYRYDAPRIHRVEVPHATVLPYQFLPKNVEFTTESLPEITTEPEAPIFSGLTTDYTDDVVNKSVEHVAIGKIDETHSLENRFEQAVNDTRQSSDMSKESILANKNSTVIELNSLPLNIRQKVPTLTYKAHVYSSIPSDRTINMNGHKHHEGDEVVKGVKLVEIEPDASVFRVGSQEFTLKALNDWIAN
jgi:hypothetical protein